MTELKNRLLGLYEGYPGDQAWEKFVKCFPEIEEELFKNIALDKDMARVMCWHYKDKLKYVNEYLQYEVPALDFNTPLEVLLLPEGRIILRSSMMRMH